MCEHVHSVKELTAGRVRRSASSVPSPPSLCYATLDISGTSALRRLDDLSAAPWLRSRHSTLLQELLQVDPDPGRARGYGSWLRVLGAVSGEAGLPLYAEPAETRAHAAQREGLKNKQGAGGFEIGRVLDEGRLRGRDDYASFGGCHQMSAALLHLPPLHGWEES